MKKNILLRMLSTATLLFSFSSQIAMAVEPEVYVVNLANLRPSITDGDTFDLHGVGRIRLRGVDAPERGQSCITDTGEEYSSAEEASRVLDALLSVGTITCIKMGKESYGRIVAYCEVDGRDVAGTMVSSGMAFHDKRFTVGEYEDILAAKESAAKESREGVWQCPDHERSWDYRKRKKSR